MSVGCSGYRDYSTYLKNGGRLIQHKKSDRNFPVKLHRIVSDPNNRHVTEWMLHGRAFRVLNKKELVRDVIPGYFECAKYESFTRQLTAWDFRRCRSGPDQGCYYHEAFLRGLPELTCFIRRIPRHCRKSDRKIITPEEDPVPPTQSTRDRKSSEPQRKSSEPQSLESNEQSSKMVENYDASRGGDDQTRSRGEIDARQAALPPQQHCPDNGSNYQAIEGHNRHDYQGPGHDCPPGRHDDLGALACVPQPDRAASAPSDAHAWGNASSPDHYDDHYHYGNQGWHFFVPHHHSSYQGHSSSAEFGYTPPSNGLPEQSYLSRQQHPQGYGHNSYEYYAPQGQGYQYYCGTSGGHDDNPHYRTSDPPHCHHSYSNFYPHPPPDYPAYSGQWRSPNHFYTNASHYNYHPAAAAQGESPHDEADQKE